MRLITRHWRLPSAVVLTFLAIEFLDELVDGVGSAAWPLIRTDLDLTYVQIGLLFAMPGVIASFIEPFIGIHPGRRGVSSTIDPRRRCGVHGGARPRVDQPGYRRPTPRVDRLLPGGRSIRQPLSGVLDGHRPVTPRAEYGAMGVRRFGRQRSRAARACGGNCAGFCLVRDVSVHRHPDNTYFDCSPSSTARTRR